MRRKSLIQMFDEILREEGVRFYCPQDEVQGRVAGENGRRNVTAPTRTGKAPRRKSRRSAASASPRRIR